MLYFFSSIKLLLQQIFLVSKILSSPLKEKKQTAGTDEMKIAVVFQNRGCGYNFQLYLLFIKNLNPPRLYQWEIPYMLREASMTCLLGSTLPWNKCSHSSDLILFPLEVPHVINWAYKLNIQKLQTISYVNCKIYSQYYLFCLCAKLLLSKYWVT